MSAAIPTASEADPMLAEQVAAEQQHAQNNARSSAVAASTEIAPSAAAATVADDAETTPVTSSSGGAALVPTATTRPAVGGGGGGKLGADGETSAVARLDDFYQLGRYTYVVCLLAELLILAQVGNMLYMTYAGAAPTLVKCGQHVFPDVEKSNKRCQAMADMERGNQANCTRENTEWDIQFRSVNVDFDYYCDTQTVKKTISYQMIGVIFGSILFGYLSDSYGRRKIMLIALVLCILAMVATSFTHNLLSFTVVRFWVNFFNAGTMVTLVVFTSEHYPKKQRFCLTNVITWSPNFVLFAIMAWCAGDWRTLQRVSAALAIPCVPILCFLSESPRFLVQCRRMAEAKVAILRMHRIDGRECDEAVLDAVLAQEERQHEATKGQKKYNYLHLFYTWRFVRYTTAVALSFFVVSLLNYSLLYNMEKLSGSLFMNGIMMGAFRYSMNLAISFGDMRFKWLGRKFAHFLADALAATALLLYIVMDLSGLRSVLPFVANWSVLSVIGFCSLLYTTNGLTANELFPTGVRNASFSFGQVLTRIGVVLAPQLFFLADFWGLLPYLLLMVFAIFDAFYFQFNVIETKDRPMGSKFPEKKERIFYGKKFRRTTGGERNTDVELLARSGNGSGGGANNAEVAAAAIGAAADDSAEKEEKK